MQFRKAIRRNGEGKVVLAERGLKVSVIEDNRDLNEMLVEDIASAGFAVKGFMSVEEYVGSGEFSDIFLLDINLPGVSGLDFARKLRANDPRTGIVVLSVRTAAEDRTAGYLNGVDIYLQKPCGADEIRAALFRLADRMLMTVEGRGDEPQDIVLDCAHLRLNGPLGDATLKPREARFLQALLQAPERQISYADCRTIFREDGDIKQSALEVAVGRVRRKLETVAQVEKAIISMREFGYRLVADVHSKT